MRSDDAENTNTSWLIASFYLFGISVFFHQQTLSWAVMFVALYFLGPRGAAHRRDAKRWIVPAPFMALAALAFYIQLEILADTPANEKGLTFGSHMLTQFKDYASTAIFPAQFDWSTVHFIAFISFLVILASLPVVTRIASQTRLRPELTLIIVVWYLVAVAPLLTPVVAIPGLFARKLYVAGPSLAILLVASGMVLMDYVPARLTRKARLIGVILLIAAVIGAFSQGITTRDRFGETAQESHHFIQSLQAAHPTLPEGGTLYVVNPPIVLKYFTDSYLISSVQAFYGKVRVVAISEAQATAIERSNRARPSFLGPPPTIFRYQGP